MHLNAYLDQHSLSEREAARRIGVAHSTLWRILRGRVIPNTTTRAKIVTATRGLVSERDLLVGAADAIVGAGEVFEAAA